MCLIPAQVVVYISNRRDRAKAAAFLMRSSLAFGILGLGLVMTSNNHTKFLNGIQQKYLSGLTDDEIRYLKTQSLSSSIEQRSLVAHQIRQRATQGHVPRQMDATTQL